MEDSQIDTLIGEYKIPGEDEIIQAYVRLFEAHFQRHYLSKGLRPQRAIHAKSHGYPKAIFEVIGHVGNQTSSMASSRSLAPTKQLSESQMAMAPRPGYRPDRRRGLWPSRSLG